MKINSNGKCFTQNNLFFLTPVAAPETKKLVVELIKVAKPMHCCIGGLDLGHGINADFIKNPSPRSYSLVIYNTHKDSFYKQYTFSRDIKAPNMAIDVFNNNVSKKAVWTPNNIELLNSEIQSYCKKMILILKDVCG